jgi:hypothetical protein
MKGVHMKRAVVFVAKHRDICNADWLVHEGAKSLPGGESATAPEAVGCELDRSGTGWNGDAE